LLRIRQLFKSIETEIFKLFIPGLVNVCLHFSLDDVRDELRELPNAPEALGKLHKLLVAIDYDDNDHELVHRLINEKDSCEPNAATATVYKDANGHSSLDDIKDVDSFKALLDVAEIPQQTMYYQRRCTIAEKWLKLREELTTNAAWYRL
jgi:hypothetical protein